MIIAMINKQLDFSKITDLKNFSGVVPILPLSSVVFFPNTLLPLHIFEQRYRDMLKDAQNSEQLILMALLKPGWEKDYYGRPDFFQIAGLGRIVNCDTQENGKSNIVLYGLKRTKIVEILDDKSYRRAKVELLDNTDGSDSGKLKDKILYSISSWNDMLDEKHKKFKININSSLPLGKLTDVLASVLITNVFEKQKYLEELSIYKRAEMINSFLDARLKVLSITSSRKEEIAKKRNLN